MMQGVMAGRNALVKNRALSPVRPSCLRVSAVFVKGPLRTTQIAEVRKIIRVTSTVVCEEALLDIRSSKITLQKGVNRDRVLAAVKIRCRSGWAIPGRPSGGPSAKR